MKANTSRDTLLLIAATVSILLLSALVQFMSIPFGALFLGLLGVALLTVQNKFLMRQMQTGAAQLEIVLQQVLSNQDPDFEKLPEHWQLVGKRLKSITTYLAVMKQSMEDRIALLEEKNQELKEQKSKIQESFLALQHYHTIQDKFRGILDIDEILAEAMELLVQEMSPNKAFFLKFDPESDNVQVHSPIGVPLHTNQLMLRSEINTYLQRFEDDQQSVLELSSSQGQDAFYGIPFTSSLLARIVIDGEAWGAICVLDKEARQGTESFVEKDRIILGNMASILQKDLKSAHLFEMATTDSLSKLCVRRYFERRMEEEIRRSQRHQFEFCLIMIDIDHFKRFNDTYGHLVGDEVIREVSLQVKNQVRNGVDIVARYGGEEIIILLPQTPQEHGEMVSERIRQTIENLDVPSLSNTKNSPHVTISVGMAAFPQHGREMKELMENADSSMYKAKESGRNRVCIYQVPENQVE
jgi:diguanylate cyclase (GGDEF)-like protein